MQLNKRFTDRDASSLTIYLQEISKFDVLSPDEEIELFTRLKNPETSDSEKQAIIDVLMQTNQRFVVTVSKQFLSLGKILTLGDLINEGNIGLRRAIDSFDITRGNRFFSYAVWWIRQHVIRSLRDSQLISLPQNQYNFLNKIRSVQETLLQKFHREPNMIEIAEALDVELIKIQEALQHEYLMNQNSLQDPIYGNNSSDDLVLEDILSGDIGTSDTGEAEELRENILRAIHKHIPTDRGQRIHKQYYGIEQKAPLDLSKIAEIENITQERVRQIVRQSLYYLKHTLKRNYFL